MQRLVDIQYQRNNVSRARGTFRVQGDTLEVFPPYEQPAIRIEWWGDTVEKISAVRPRSRARSSTATSSTSRSSPPRTTWPREERMKRALVTIEEELAERLATLEGQGKLLEAERLRMRTNYDLEMMREVGFCSGIENYSRHIDGRERRQRPVHPARLLPRRLPGGDRRVPRDGADSCDGMYEGDLSRKSDAGRARVPAAERDRQPAAALRGVQRAGPPGRVHVGDAERLRDEARPTRSSSRSCDRPVWSTPRCRSDRRRGRSTT